MKINELDINASGEQILNDLRSSLNQNGIFLLEKIKHEHSGNVQFTCPAHKDGQEKSPSCGMATEAMIKHGKKIEAGTVHCFTCGYTATLTEFISFCFGYKDGGLFGNKWLKSNYRTELIEKIRHFTLDFSRYKENSKEYINIDESLLDELRYTHDYMYKRHLTDDVIEKFDIGYDIKTDCITFPVADLKGNVKWIQTRNINKKIYYIPEGIVKTDFLYAADKIIQENIKTAVVVESVFNALTLWKLGRPAIALFGTGGGDQYNLLKKLPVRHYIIALDNDEAGRKGTDRLIKNLGQYKLLSRIIYNPGDNRDINDLNEDVLKLKKMSINF